MSGGSQSKRAASLALTVPLHPVAEYAYGRTGTLRTAPVPVASPVTWYRAQQSSASRHSTRSPSATLS